MNVIDKISCYFERSAVTLKLRKEYWKTVTHNIPVLLRIKYWTAWYIERYSMSTYTRVTYFQKTFRFFVPPCMYGPLNKRKSVEVGVFRRGWVILSTNFRRKGESPTVGVRKLEWLPFVWYQNIHSALFGFVTKHAGDWQTDGRTDRQGALKMREWKMQE